MARNYYLILGVPVDAEPAQIRSAFRKLALRHHPDRHQQVRPGAFEDISEAYAVLSDPVRRARYDRKLRGARTSLVDAPATYHPESLHSEPVSIFGQEELVRPSYEALLDRLWRNFEGLETPKAEREEPLDFELILNPEEAARGVVVPFEVPVFAPCRECGGIGRRWLFLCEECGGEGRIVYHDAVQVRVPGGVPDGAVIEVSLARLGIENLWLRVHVRIERH